MSNKRAYSDEKVADREFIDCLREALGLDPMYRAEKASNYLYEHPNYWEMAPGCKRSNSRHF